MWKGIPSHVHPWGIPWGYREAAHVESQFDDDRDAMQLSPRQRQVLQLLAEGRSMRETAKILDITPRTVAFHKYRMMKQLRLKTSVELIKFAIKEGIASL